MVPLRPGRPRQIPECKDSIRHAANADPAFAKLQILVVAFEAVRRDRERFSPHTLAGLMHRGRYQDRAAAGDAAEPDGDGGGIAKADRHAC